MGHVWWAPAIDLSLSALALAGASRCHSDKQLHPQITAVIPLGIDQGLLFIQSLFISMELRAESVLLLAFCCGSLVHCRPPAGWLSNTIWLSLKSGRLAPPYITLVSLASLVLLYPLQIVYQFSTSKLIDWPDWFTINRLAVFLCDNLNITI